jgi:Ca-activated chloride channel family protein
MKKIAAAIIVLFGFSVIGLAQSGRRVEPQPKATPGEKTDDTPDYSESKPQPKRPVYSLPTLRQSTASRPKSDATSPTDNTSADEEDVVKVGTDLITIPVSVFDRNGLYIPGLKQADFKIFEDGEEQDIAYFGTSEKPFTVILLIDTSPSTEYKIDEIQRAAIAFVDQLKPQDSVMVIEFDANVHVLTESTNNRELIYKAIRRADFGGGTSLYDAVQFSLAKRLSAVQGRKAIVLFTDGVDTASHKANFDSTLNTAEESESLIFPIYYNTFFETARGSLGDINGGVIPSTDRGYNPPGTTAAEYALGKKYLEELANYTGGRVFRPESTPGGLTAAFEGIAEELRRQYNIGYVPKKDGTPGQRKQIRVRVDRPNLVLRARDSYIVGKNNQPAKAGTPN